MRMNRCPMFVAVETVEAVDNDVDCDVYGDGATKANCGECGRWDAERQKCRDEERLRELK